MNSKMLLTDISNDTYYCLVSNHNIPVGEYIFGIGKTRIEYFPLIV